MAKQERLEFDYEEYFDEMFQTTAVVMFSTHIPSYTFAFFLNEIYGIELERSEDVVISKKGYDVECIVYSYCDKVMHNAYFMVENITNPTVGKSANTIFDKMLLITGTDAYAIARGIFNDLGERDIFSDTGGERLLSEEFVQAGILESALFDFSDADAPSTTYFSSESVSPALQRKKTQFFREQREYVTDILIAIDHLLPTYEEDGE